jgi:hypothetical protein
MAGYQAPQDGPGQGWPRSRSCLTGTHEDCGHLGSTSYDLWDGGRPSLLLCQCGCHSTCSLAGRLPLVSRVIWVGLCTCPGTELAEDKLDEAEREAPEFPDLEQLVRERQEQRTRERQEEKAAMRAALEATRAAAAGKSRAQIREIYLAELRARGLTVPSEPVPRRHGGRDCPGEGEGLTGLFGPSASRTGPGVAETPFALRIRCVIRA